MELIIGSTEVCQLSLIAESYGLCLEDEMAGKKVIVQAVCCGFLALSNICVADVGLTSEDFDTLINEQGGMLLNDNPGEMTTAFGDDLPSCLEACTGAFKAEFEMCKSLPERDERVECFGDARAELLTCKLNCFNYYGLKNIPELRPTESTGPSGGH